MTERTVTGDSEREQKLVDALTQVRGQLSLGPDGDKAREIIRDALAALEQEQKPTNQPKGEPQ